MMIRLVSTMIKRNKTRNFIC